MFVFESMIPACHRNVKIARVLNVCLISHQLATIVANSECVWRHSKESNSWLLNHRRRSMPSQSILIIAIGRPVLYTSWIHNALLPFSFVRVQFLHSCTRHTNAHSAHWHTDTDVGGIFCRSPAIMVCVCVSSLPIRFSFSKFGRRTIYIDNSQQCI